MPTSLPPNYTASSAGSSRCGAGTARDVRIKACFRVNSDDFYTAHHELGYNFYQRAYQEQPMLFRSGANDGFHEAIGDFAALNALTPAYLQPSRADQPSLRP